MNVSEALRTIKKNGGKARRTSWDGSTIEYVPESEETMETISVTLWNGRRVIGWQPNITDLFADDWEII